MRFFGLRQNPPADRRTVWNTELFRRALAEKEIDQLAKKVRQVLIERRALTENLAKHNDGLGELRADISTSKIGTAERILIIRKIRILEASKRKINRELEGVHLPARIQSLTEIARGIAEAPNRPTLELWPECIEDKLLSLSTPNTRRPPNWVADQITRIIDSIEGSCLPKDDKNLLIALGALAMRD